MTSADVCIVGSGFAGTLLAQKLVASGLRTVLLEAGTESSPSPSSPSLFSCSMHAETVPGYQPLTVFKLVGGHSGLWGGTTLRFPRGLFEGRGPEGPTTPWPIRCDDLETHYVDAEKLLLADGVPPGSDLAAEIGRSPYLSRFSESVAAQGGLLPFTTRISRLRLAESVIPRLERSRDFELIRGVTATSVVMATPTRAEGISFRRADRTTGRAAARVIVLACGAIQTPRLLLASRSGLHPNGVGNDQGQVGRRLADHYQIVPDLLCLRDPAVQGDGHGFSWTRHWKHPDLAVPFFVLGTGVGTTVTGRDVILSERAWGRRLETLLSERVGAHIELRILVAMSSQADNRIDLDPRQVDEAGEAVARVRLRPDQVDHEVLARVGAWIRRVYGKFDLRALRLGAGPVGGAHFSGGHLSGTCRMGNDPKQSVVDPDLRVHRTENLYLSGGATFPTSGAQNPTLTISAMTLRLGEHLVRRIRAGQA